LRVVALLEVFTDGQWVAVFGVADLRGIELMPGGRNWRL
jgi:hypothetical protein